MHPTVPRVDRDEIVRIITDFYIFLTKLHIPESALKLPPSGGWPNITPESTKNFNKSPLVVDLIKHLPYIDSKDAGEMITHVEYKCDVVDWSVYTPEDFDREGEGDYRTAEEGIRYWISELEEKQKRQESSVETDVAEEGNDSGDESDGWGEGWEHFGPGDDPEVTDRPNLIGIAQGYESCGRDFTLDVFKGVMYDDQLRCNFLGGWDVEDFFKELQQKFEDLDLVPIRGDMLEADYEEVNEYREIYRRHGWPGADFRKEEALAAVEIVRKRREMEEESAKGY